MQFFNLVPICMRKTLLLLLLISWTPLLYAQEVAEPKVKFGEFNLADLEMKFYDKDSSADAVVLYDYGQTSFDVPPDVPNQRFVYHRRIKILKKSALNLGTISLLLVKGGIGKEQLISNIKGFTYNLENGSVKKEELGKESIFIEKPVGGTQNIKITMPNVKEGSIIEYTYTIKTPFGMSFNPSTWNFQEANPVVLSICEVVVPTYLNYKMLFSGYLKEPTKKTEMISERVGDLYIQGLIHRYIMKDVPAFREEAYMTNPEDNISKIEFELERMRLGNTTINNFLSDYPTMNKTLLGDDIYGDLFKKTGFLKEVAKEIKSKHSDSTSRLKAAYEYVQKNIKWNKGFSIYSKDLKKVLEAREGNAGEINLLLVALLREIGFEASPVILSTRRHGRILDEYAILKRFNYVVAHIIRNGKNFLMDATDKDLKLGMLPVHCLNGVGWLVHPTKSGFVPTIPAEKNVEFKSTNLVLDEEGELKGSFIKSYGGYSGLKAKKEFKDIGKDKYLEESRKENATWAIEKADFVNTDEVEMPMEERYQVTSTDYITKAGNMLYLKPMLSEGQKQNLLKAKERLYPVDFVYPREETLMATYELPKDYSIMEIPKNTSLTLPEGAGKFTYVTVVKENKLTLTSRVQFHKAVYYADEYPFLQEFFDKIVAKHQEQIVLKKN